MGTHDKISWEMFCQTTQTCPVSSLHPRDSEAAPSCMVVSHIWGMEKGEEWRR